MFPRESNHCFSHHIPSNIAQLKQDDYDLAHITEQCAIALSYLRSQNADLRKGDLILFDANIGYRNDGVCIFNGDRIVDLYAEVDDYGSLPPEFRVIENNVPLLYWKDIDDTDNGRGISHNSIVWFNHHLVKDQCLSNLQFSLLETNRFAIHTRFTYLNTTYRIIFDHTELQNCQLDRTTYEFLIPSQKEIVLSAVKSVLNGNKLIVFESEDRLNDPPIDDNTTLFVHLWDNGN